MQQLMLEAGQAVSGRAAPKRRASRSADAHDERSILLRRRSGASADEAFIGDMPWSIPTPIHRRAERRSLELGKELERSGARSMRQCGQSLRIFASAKGAPPPHVALGYLMASGADAAAPMAMRSSTRRTT
jgi:hypothetical protein